MALVTKNTMFCCTLTGLLFYGIYDFFVNIDNHECEMTYMWQWPQYIPVKNINTDVGENYSNYNLYLYGEGVYATKSQNLKLNGIPVLYIPGSSGNYKQVRSLASVSLRKSEKDRNRFHFNYFTVDLNEEAVGFHGVTLQQQTEYISHCVKHILALYQEASHPPKSIILIGHSMGGLIAQALYTLPNFDFLQVETVITLSTPHVSPSVNFEPKLAEFYHRINSFWRTHQNDSALKHVTFLSVAGGYRDKQVRSGLVNLHGLVHPKRFISVLTNSIPKVWVSPDHICIVWCKQLVLAIVRATFDMIDSTSRQILTNPGKRMKVFEHHFLESNQHLIGFLNNNNKTITFKGNITKRQKIYLNQWQFTGKLHSQTFYTFPLNDRNFSGVYLVSNSTSNNWLYGCLSQDFDEQCKEAESLSQRAVSLPPLYTNYTQLIIQRTLLSRYSHIILSLPKNQEVDFMIDFYNKTDRYISVELPYWFSPFSHNSLTTKKGATYYKLHLGGLDKVWQAYRIRSIPIDCADHNITAVHNMTLRKFSPWFNEIYYSVTKTTEVNQLSLKLHSQRPFPSNNTSVLSLEILLNARSNCTYLIQVESSLQEIMGQFIRFYGIFIPSFVIINIIMVMSKQIQQLSQLEETAQSFIWIQSSYNKPYYIVLPVVLFKATVQYFPILQLPEMDSDILEERNISFGPMLLLFFLFGYVITWFLASMFDHFILFISWIILVFFGIKSFSSIKNKSAVSWQSWFGYSIILFIEGVCLYVCGSLAVLMGFIFCLLKTCKCHAECMSKDCSRVSTEEKEENQHKSKYYFYYYTLTFLLLCQFIITSSSLVPWFKNLRNTIILPYDTFKNTAAVTCFCATFILSPMVELKATKNRNLIWLSSLLLYFMCLLIAIFALDSFYRLPTFIAVAFVIISIVHIF